MNIYALITTYPIRSSTIFLIECERIPTLKQANKELKRRYTLTKNDFFKDAEVIAVVETLRNPKIQYQSMAFKLTKLED